MGLLPALPVEVFSNVGASSASAFFLMCACLARGTGGTCPHTAQPDKPAADPASSAGNRASISRAEDLTGGHDSQEGKYNYEIRIWRRRESFCYVLTIGTVPLSLGGCYPTSSRRQLSFVTGGNHPLRVSGLSASGEICEVTRDAGQGW